MAVGKGVVDGSEILLAWIVMPGIRKAEDACVLEKVVGMKVVAGVKIARGDKLVGTFSGRAGNAILGRLTERVQRSGGHSESAQAARGNLSEAA